jgi:hypothetical protein
VLLFAILAILNRVITVWLVIVGGIKKVRPKKERFRTTFLASTPRHLEDPLKNSVLKKNVLTGTINGTSTLIE